MSTSRLTNKKANCCTAELETILEINHSLDEYDNLDDLVSFIIKRVRSLIDADAISIIVPDDSNHAFCFRWADNSDGDQSAKLREINFNIHLGIAGSVYKNGKAEFVPDVQNDPRHYKKIDQILGFLTKSMIAVPLHGNNEMIGVLEIINKRSGAFTDRDFNMISASAALIGIAIENAFSSADLRKAYSQIKRTEEELKKYRHHLENQVKKRTRELKTANQKLRDEIVERKKVEDKLREYQRAIESSDDLIYAIDREYVYLFANEAFLKYHCLNRDQVIGFSAADVLDKASFGHIKPNLDRCMQGIPVNFEVEYKFPLIGKKYLDVHYYPLRNGDRKISGVVTVIKDITERKRTEEALRQSEERYRTLVENIDFGVTLINSGHDIVMVNAAQGRKFKKSPREFIGKKCYREFEKRDSICPHCPGVHATATRQSSEAETEGILDDGSRYNAKIQASPIFDSSGAVTGFIEIVEDITEKKGLQAQLLQSQKLEAIGTLAGGIAHDFNNLLMAIQGNISLALYDISPDHPHCEIFQNIEKQVRSGAKLTGQLLGYARKGRYEVKPVNLNQLVEEASQAFGRTRKEIVIQKNLAEDLSSIEADEGQIEQVLFNLYVNAADAMPHGGKLAIKTMNVTHEVMNNKAYIPKPGHYVLLEIADTGVGMDHKTLERIFDPFYTTKEMGRGTGLGLASVYGIVKGHGGYIDVQSEKGHGTVFTIYLPGSEKKINKTVKQPVAIMKGKETILFVDDESIISDVGVMMLENLGYKVHSAQNGIEAVEIYKKHKDQIDLAILDMIMPDMGGGELYDRLKEINPDVKAILSSGYSIDGQAGDILRRGCNGFIQKPFTLQDLSQKLREIIDT